MGKRLLDIPLSLKQPWLVSILCAAAIPLFPEYFAPLLAAGSLLAAYADAKAGKRRVSVGLLGKLMIAYIAYMLLGVFYSDHLESTLSTAMMWIAMFTVCLSMTTVLISRHRLDTALFCICFVAGVVGLIATLQYGFYLLGRPISMQLWSFIDQHVLNALPLTLLPLNNNRPSATFNNPNILAEYLAMALPFVAYYAFSGLRAGLRVLCRFCFMFTLSGMVFSFSRGSYIALIVVLLVFCIANIRKILIFLMTIVSVILFIPEPVISRLFSISTRDKSISDRLLIWNAGLNQIGHSPVFGIGAGISGSWDVLSSSNLNVPHMHNLFIQIAVEGGVIALALMGMIGFILLRFGYTLLRNYGDEARAIGVSLLAFIGAFCTHGMVDFPLMTPKLVGMFVLFISLGDVAVRLYTGRLPSVLSDLRPFAPLNRLRRKNAAAAVSNFSNDK